MYYVCICACICTYVFTYVSATSEASIDQTLTWPVLEEREIKKTIFIF